jgi:uncharacterized protein YukE
MNDDDATITYDYQQCEGIYEDLVRDQATISTQMTDLMSSVNAFMLGWVGTSPDQWQAIQRAWNQEMAKMGDDLSMAAAAIPEMTATIKNIDQSSAIRIGSIGR